MKASEAERQLSDTRDRVIQMSARLSNIKLFIDNLGVSPALCANCDKPDCEVVGKAMMEIENLLRNPL